MLYSTISYYTVLYNTILFKKVEVGIPHILYYTILRAKLNLSFDQFSEVSLSTIGNMPEGCQSTGTDSSTVRFKIKRRTPPHLVTRFSGRIWSQGPCLELSGAVPDDALPAYPSLYFLVCLSMCCSF